MDEFKPWGMEEKTFLMLMHLSQLAGFLVPGAGLVLPIVMWATNREQSERIDAHGKVILNWLISVIIYAVICFILTFIVIGALLFVALGITSLVFIIMAALKANEGVLWPYPLSFKFIK
ncbi:DUF4870 domain-containing protein [Aestuariibacter sp. A3R04]|uniref:DUF4870 domain-containing protein n=1 Tax=Aestuariibacter sp. A3R04 TaxID=2841571 RepID=UPI001C09586B|nr:DUF4870 domain-containing protein [Aestuariibacter sp. A3R04]MBU3023480.1 DUF4870 domain-containing protein [Aestuariibacter sp. A3R04]